MGPRRAEGWSDPDHRRITRDSVQELGLAAGVEATASAKATWVMVEWGTAVRDLRLAVGSPVIAS